ncbi:MAG TPA: iron-sulfur cluster assembly scaffold protein [Anaeromyxobacteraceae bacterium]|nr:iron-sulfur cluster assembly scaffold protein [Anaeromyxobacteraceae bacterium]
MTDPDVYQGALLDLARQATGAGRLEAPDGSATLDNPLCGDRATFEVRVRAGRIEALAHRVRGCVLCQATASLLGREALGAGAAEVSGSRRAAAELLGEGRPPGPDAFPGLSSFAPVQAVPSRHRCVLLPFDALSAALAAAGK